jgi:hypothetical protein
VAPKKEFSVRASRFTRRFFWRIYPRLICRLWFVPRLSFVFRPPVSTSHHLPIYSSLHSKILILKALHKYIRIYLYSVGTIIKRKANNPSKSLKTKSPIPSPLFGLKNLPHRLPHSKTLNLKVVHKYIRIYLYTYISVQSAVKQVQ